METENKNTETWFTKREAAKHMDVSIRTIERLQAEGKITAYKVRGWFVRYKKSELDTYMKPQKIKSKKDMHTCPGQEKNLQR